MESFKIAVYISILFSSHIFKLVLTDDSKSENKFLYFAYGSNLLARRVHINNPTAEFFSSAKLPNFRLDFQSFDTEFWNGADATIVDDSDSVVWGALWTLDVKDIPHLDEQEGIHLSQYRTRNVSVATPDGRSMVVRTYQMTLEPPKLPAKDIPPERQPSDTYMEVIIRGAFECSLPMHYLRFLFTFPTNGKLASWTTRQRLGYPFNVTELK
ncbi:gamma-glutamylcyclotransferase-like [Danaus plexippus]|uniref:gamma-glutamylcyclotransferase-like n=1 Tax=Danaus plexippus TaxID=13037 RepID=UPI002AB0F89C|nr:gamma-glutamylcyclotransferase-like [Danaus plexippus]